MPMIESIIITQGAPATNKRPAVATQTVATNIQTSHDEAKPQTTVSRSVAADGSLLSVMELVPCLDIIVVLHALLQNLG